MGLGIGRLKVDREGVWDLFFSTEGYSESDISVLHTRFPLASTADICV